MKTQGISALRHNPADALLGSDPSPASVKLRMLVVRISRKKIKIGYDCVESERGHARGGSFSKSRKVLGWHPRVYLEEGLEPLCRTVGNRKVFLPRD